MERKKGQEAADQEIIGQEGSIGDLLSVGICILAMITIMMSFMDCVALIGRKTAAGQIARNYILRMETVGYLTKADEECLREELTRNGITDIDLEGTTKEQTVYGTEITLRIRGKIGGSYGFEELRRSTAKN